MEGKNLICLRNLPYVPFVAGNSIETRGHKRAAISAAELKESCNSCWPRLRTAAELVLGRLSDWPLSERQISRSIKKFSQREIPWQRPQRRIAAAAANPKSFTSCQNSRSRFSDTVAIPPPKKALSPLTAISGASEHFADSWQLPELN